MRIGVCRGLLGLPVLWSLLHPSARVSAGHLRLEQLF